MTRLQRCHHFDSAQFLSEYWQQKPKVIRGFVDGFSDPVSADELAGLACEASVESRLVIGAGESDWRLEHGPFEPERFADLDDADWTLLVQAVDQWDEAVAELIGLVDFLPSWRLDDVMVSYAAKGGGIAAHFDTYDVFLLQGSGQRRWELGQFCDEHTPVNPIAGQSMLKEFAISQTVTLNSGDLLYVPARLAHRGVATVPGLNFSLGFRAPSFREMLEGVSDLWIDAADPLRRFRDPAPETWPAHRGELGDQVVREFREYLLELAADDQGIKRWFGSAVTQPRYPELIEGLPALTPWSALMNALDGGARLCRHPAARFAFTRVDESELMLFAAGESYLTGQQNLQLVADLCDESLRDLTASVTRCCDQDGQTLILALLSQGVIYY